MKNMASNFYTSSYYALHYTIIILHENSNDAICRELLLKQTRCFCGNTFFDGLWCFEVFLLVYNHQIKGYYWGP